MSTWGMYTVQLRSDRQEQIRRRQEEQRREKVRQEAMTLITQSRRTQGRSLDHMTQYFGQSAQQQAENLAQQATESLQSDPDMALQLARQAQATAERGIAEVSARVYEWRKEKAAAEEAVTILRLTLDSLLKDSTPQEKSDTELVAVTGQLSTAKAALRREDFEAARQSAVAGQQRIRQIEQSRRRQREKEEVRREVVRGLRHVLMEMGFTVKPAQVGRNGEEGKVVLAGRLPSGRKTRFVIALDGRVKYDFDGYPHRDCGKDSKKIRRQLEEHLQAETSDTETHWKGPDQIGRNAKDLPSDQRNLQVTEPKPAPGQPASRYSSCGAILSQMAELSDDPTTVDLQNLLALSPYVKNAQHTRVPGPRTDLVVVLHAYDAVEPSVEIVLFCGQIKMPTVQNVNGTIPDDRTRYSKEDREVMPQILSIVFVLLLFIGPVRRRVFGACRFLLPAVLGGVIACMLLGKLEGADTIPTWVVVAVPIIAAVATGSGCRQWFHDNFPTRRT